MTLEPDLQMTVTMKKTLRYMDLQMPFDLFLFLRPP
jgi:hypothetical protein